MLAVEDYRRFFADEIRFVANLDSPARQGAWLPVVDVGSGVERDHHVVVEVTRVVEKRW